MLDRKNHRIGLSTQITKIVRLDSVDGPVEVKFNILVMSADIEAPNRSAAEELLRVAEEKLDEQIKPDKSK